MRIECLGGSSEVGRSAFVVWPRRGEPVLLDCGVKRVFGPGTAGEYPLLAPDRLPEIRHVLISHAHEDHCAALPYLLERGGAFTVYAHALSLPLIERYVNSWSTAVQGHGLPAPYAVESLKKAIWRPVAYGKTFTAGGFSVTSGAAAHLPGSIFFVLDDGHERLCYTGDWNPDSLLFAKPRFPACNILITNAMGRVSATQGLQSLHALCGQAASRPLLFALPRYGRGQEILAALCAQQANAVDLCIDDSLLQALKAYREDPAVSPEGRALLATLDAQLAAGRWQRFSKASSVKDLRAGCILSCDAMLSAGNAAVLSPAILAADGAVIFSGHLAAGTPGYDLLHNGHPGALRLPWKIHPQPDDVRAIVAQTGADRVLLVHCERDVAETVGKELLAGASAPAALTVHIPAPGDVLDI